MTNGQVQASATSSRPARSGGEPRLLPEEDPVHKRSLALITTGAALALGATACGSPGAAAGSGSTSQAGKTLTVWYMDGDLSNQAQAAVNTAFEKATGAKVR